MKVLSSAWESVTIGAVGTWSFVTQTISKYVTARHLQCLAVVLALVTCYHILVMCGVVSYGGTSDGPNDSHVLNKLNESVTLSGANMNLTTGAVAGQPSAKEIQTRGPVIDALEIYKTLAFNEPATWNSKLEERLAQPKKFPLKIMLLKHILVEPEPNLTALEYSHSARRIITSILETLKKSPNMTFQWSEVSRLHDWWLEATETDKSALKELVESGRLEIVTGGWTTTNEAVVNVYSMIDQLIEGQHWVTVQLYVFPKTSWSLDTYGNGPVFPYILTQAGIKATIIMETNYAWKKYSADNQKGDFLWIQRWDAESVESSSNTPGYDMLVHLHHCNVDLGNTDFSPVKPNDLSCSSLASFPIPVGLSANEFDIKAMADVFVKEARKIGSLFTHNVALITVQGGSKFENGTEVDFFGRILEYIKDNNTDYENIEVDFGTINDYFLEIQKRQQTFPGFVGDLVPYSETKEVDDGYSEFVKPLYWSGYFSSRPFLKKLYRETEATLRDAEILFSFANMATRQHPSTCFNQKNARELYKDLQTARRDHAQFARHDGQRMFPNEAILVERRMKLKEAQDKASKVQLNCARCLTFISLYGVHENLTANLTSTWSRKHYLDLPKSKGLIFNETVIDTKRIVIFNSFGWRRAEMVYVEVNVSNETSSWFEVMGPNRKWVLSQLAPVLESVNGTLEISQRKFRLTFMAELDPVSLSVFTVKNVKEKTPFSAFHSIYQNYSPLTSPELLDTADQPEEPEYQDNGTPKKKNEISIRNGRLKILLDPKNGFASMRTMIRGFDKRTWIDIKLSFGSYTAVDLHSDVNIFMPKEGSETLTVLGDIPEKMYVVRGTIFTELIIIKRNIIQTLRLLHTSAEWIEMENAVYIQNKVNTKDNAGEFYMRVDSNLESKTLDGIPAFFTDQSGFSFEKRVKIEKLGLAGNSYPVNTMGYIQDDVKGFRLSLLVDRAHGISSFESGRLEVLIERFIKGEPSVETISNYVLLLEDLHPQLNSLDYKDTFPTILTHHLSQALSYPVSIFLASTAFMNREINVETEFSIIPLFNQEFPCNTHLVNLRTLFQITPNVDLDKPGLSTVMILQKLGYSYDKYKPDFCEAVPGSLLDRSNLFYKDTRFTTFNQEFRPILADLTGLRNPTNQKRGAEMKDKKVQDPKRLENIKSEAFELTSILIGFPKDEPRVTDDMNVEG